MKATHGEEQRDEKADSSLRRFRFQVTAKDAESESGGESVRENLAVGADKATDCALNFPRQSG